MWARRRSDRGDSNAELIVPEREIFWYRFSVIRKSMWTNKTTESFGNKKDANNEDEDGRSSMNDEVDLKGEP